MSKHLRVPKHALREGAVLPGSPKSARKRSRVPTILKTAAVIGAGVVVGVAGSAGTYAAWNDKVTIPAGTISTGSTLLRVASGDHRSTPSSWTSSANLGAPIATMSVGSKTATLYTVGSKGTTPEHVTLASISHTATNDLFNQLRVRVKEVSSQTDCTTALTGGTENLLSSFPANVTLFDLDAAGGANAARLVCVVFELPTGSTGVDGQTADFTMNLAGKQLIG
jgi:predicted ribosomally synthesized peptide with SipW-like signal peptide